MTSGTAPAHVRVLGLWSGPELDSFRTVEAAWEAGSGFVLDWKGASDLRRSLATAIAAGDPPDIAVLPNVGLLHELAADDRLLPLSTAIDPVQLERDYAAPWLDLGSHGGVRYGIFYKVTNKATVWYAPKAFATAGYEVPRTWAELMALADRMVADGRTPFSVVAPRLPGGGGWALTDWISQIVLSTCGATVYDGWVAGDRSWTDPCVADAFDRFATLVATPGYVLGGSRGILGTSDAEGTYPLYTDPPTAYLYYLASFAQAFIAERFPALVPGTDYDWFPFPAGDANGQAAITVGADVVVMLRDTPAARSLMQFLAGAEAQRAWITLGGFTSVNRTIPSSAYADPVARRAAEELTSATTVRYSAGDLMAPTLQRAWWKGMLDLVQHPDTRLQLLESLSALAHR